MKNEEFVYWISGYLTLSNEDSLNERQFSIIKNHANLVKEVSGRLDPAITDFMVVVENLLQKFGSLKRKDLSRLAGKVLNIFNM